MMGLSLREERGEQSVVLTEREGKENERLKEKKRGREGARGGKTTGLVFASGVTLREGCV